MVLSRCADLLLVVVGCGCWSLLSFHLSCFAFYIRCGGKVVVTMISMIMVLNHKGDIMISRQYR
jgi:hypothetical protein